MKAPAGRDRCSTRQTKPELKRNICFDLLVFSLHLVEGQSTPILVNELRRIAKVVYHHPRCGHSSPRWISPGAPCTPWLPAQFSSLKTDLSPPIDAPVLYTAPLCNDTQHVQTHPTLHPHHNQGDYKDGPETSGLMETLELNGFTCALCEKERL